MAEMVNPHNVRELKLADRNPREVGEFTYYIFGLVPKSERKSLIKNNPRMKKGLVRKFTTGNMSHEFKRGIWGILLVSGKIIPGEEKNIELPVTSLKGIGKLDINVVIQNGDEEILVDDTRDIPDHAFASLKGIENLGARLENHLFLNDPEEGFGFTYADVNEKLLDTRKIMDEIQEKNAAFFENPEFKKIYGEFNQFLDTIINNHNKQRPEVVVGIKHSDFNERIRNLVAIIRKMEGEA